MLKSVEKCIKAMSLGYDHFKVGNHRAERFSDGTIAYYYHDTAICVVSKGKAHYDAGQWAGSPSTTRAINSYKSYYC